MSEDSEESCLVNSRSFSQSSVPGQMQYTDEVEAGPNFGTEMNKVPNLNENISPPGSNAVVIARSISLTNLNCPENDVRLVHHNNLALISQFHDNAIEQTRLGNFQLLATFICALGLASQAIQISALYYILPSAEFEYCIIGDQKTWISSVTLLGLGFGALVWGGLAGQIGRRKTLLTCLSISVIFSVVAAFMPTYELFMVARFWAAAGVGGVFPAGASYVCEVTPTNYRARMLSIFCTTGLMGADLAGSVASVLIPSAGKIAINESKNFFNSWHQYLLVISLPTVFSIFGLLWMPESPRWLLDVDRETEALAIYQKIFRVNRARPSHSIREVELPSTTVQPNEFPKNVFDAICRTTIAFFDSYRQLLRHGYCKSTVLLFISWTLALSVCYGLVIFNVEHAKALESFKLNQDMVAEYNLTYKDTTFNITLENISYRNVVFKNCSFRRIYINHVNFNNCSISDTDFSNIKSSHTLFSNSYFDNVKFVDTDISQKNFANCAKINTKVNPSEFTCEIDFELNYLISMIWEATSVGFVPITICVLLVGEFSHAFGRIQTAVTCFAFAIIACFLMGFAISPENIKWIIGVIQALILSGLATLTLFTVEQYKTALRCSALGLFCFGAYLGAIFAAPLYLAIPFKLTYVAAGMSVLILGIPALASSVLKDPPLLL